MKKAGGRFLKQDEGGWVEISDDQARLKVSHTFRNHRIAERASLKKLNAAKEKQTSGKKHHEEDDSSSSDLPDSLHSDSDQQKRRRLSDFSNTVAV